MATEDLSRFKATDPAQIADEDVDLDATAHHDRQGKRITERDADEYTTSRRRGRPSLSGRAGSAGHLTLRVTDELRRDVEDIAAAEGKPVAEVARQALEEYVARRAS